ncbi:MAG TPA: hypothetical protein ACFYD6_01615 [Candidatus Brocadiia bacterium]|nr:hypothetical protein [Candidatus Brocadiales bacterium]
MTNLSCFARINTVYPCHPLPHPEPRVAWTNSFVRAVPCVIILFFSSVFLQVGDNFAAGGCHWWDTGIYEVGAGRLCIISNTEGSAENFAQGDTSGRCGPIKVNKGSTVAFKSGFGYEMVWYSNATGTQSLSVTVELSRDGQNWESYDSTEHRYFETGPKIHANSVDVWVEFNEVGTVYVKTILTAVSHPVDGAEQQVIDEVITEVNVD